MSSSFGLSSLEDENLIISAVRNGNLISLEVYLNEHNDKIINKLYNFDHNNLSILMGCCYYKHVNLVRMLLKRRSCLSIDLLGTIIFDSSYIHPEIATGVPALWIATAMNHFEIVKLLVEIGGANINHVTESHSTAFRVACFNGNLELCKYLVKHGANYKQSRKGNYTNIMVSAYWKHEHIIHYLIDELNCDPNEQSEHGRTALHNSIESESIEITKYLLEKGVPLTRDTQTNLTPLLLAAKNLKFNLMNLFENFCSKIEWIEAMELVAAVYASQESDNYNLNKAYQYLNDALNLRIKYNLPKTLSEDCHEIFDCEQECQTIDELEKLEQNSNRFHIESLLIFERILGLNHDDYYYSLRYYGASLIDSNHFYKGLQIWIYQLNLSQKYLIHHDNTQLLRTFVQVFLKIQQNKQINYEFGRNLYKIIFIIYQLIKNKDQYTDFNIHTLLYLITILATVLEEGTLSLNDHVDLYKLIQSIMRSNEVRTNDSNSTLLHLSVNQQTEEYYPNKYPCLKTIYLLIKIGIEIDEIDKERNTSLHILIKNGESSSQIYQLIDLLYDFGGAHLDFVNINNKTPIDMTNNILIQNYLKEKKKIFNLKCLCARFIKIKQISFEQYLNKSLIHFIDKH